MQTIPVETLTEGDMIDLESDPYYRDDPSAEFDYALVHEVEIYAGTVFVTTTAGSLSWPPDSYVSIVARHFPRDRNSK